MTLSGIFGAIECKWQGGAEQVVYGGSEKVGDFVLYSVIMKEVIR